MKRSLNMVPCTCAGTCAFLVFDHIIFDDEADREFYCEIYIKPGKGTWRWRIKSAWDALLGRSIGQDLVIDNQRGVELRDWLTRHLEAA